jgi:hypothetical protein
VGRRVHAGIFARAREVGKGVVRWRRQVALRLSLRITRKGWVTVGRWQGVGVGCRACGRHGASENSSQVA